MCRRQSIILTGLKFFISLSFLLSLTLSSYAEQTNSPQSSNINSGKSSTSDTTILVLGDSLSAAFGINEEDGWVALLEKQLNKDQHPATLINASISGETTGGGLARLPKLLSRYQPNIVILELGANDGLRGYPIGNMKKNLQAIITLSKENGAEVLLLGMQIPPNYGSRYTEAFRKSYFTIAEQKNISLVPFFLEGVATNMGLMQKDGIHPTAQAQPLLLANVKPYLSPLFQP
ncbi:MAG: arylesterase [Cellvibrionaceae bacterium]